MHSQWFTFCLWLIGLVATAQTINISPRKVQFDNRPITLKCAFGQLTVDHSLRLRNHTGLPVQVQLYTRGSLPFIYFLNQHGDYENKIRFWLSPRTQFSVPLLVYARQGRSTVYTDYINVVLSVGNGQQVLGNVLTEVELTAYLYNTSKKHQATPLYKPAGYNIITVGGLPARFDTLDFPIKICSNHRIFGGNEYGPLVRRSLNLWNAVAKSIGISRPFFEYVENEKLADIQIDWSGQDLSSQTAGMAVLEQVGLSIFAAGIFMRKPGSNPPGEMLETLSQELCHLLGVEHSSVPDDIMNGTAHGHWHDLSEVELTERDRQILMWLYAQVPFCRISK